MASKMMATEQMDAVFPSSYKHRLALVKRQKSIKNVSFEDDSKEDRIDDKRTFHPFPRLPMEYGFPASRCFLLRQAFFVLFFHTLIVFRYCIC